MTITKMDAMRRQVLTAVKLWFDDGDPVAIHTLLFASHEILHTLFRQRGHEHLMFDSPAVRPQYRKEWATALREAGTFFKRARADPTSTLEFNRNLNEMYLLFSIYGLNQMGRSSPKKNKLSCIGCSSIDLKYSMKGPTIVTRSNKLRNFVVSQRRNSFIRPSSPIGSNVRGTRASDRPLDENILLNI